jgi:Ca2+-binding RTX toxin-like protein
MAQSIVDNSEAPSGISSWGEEGSDYYAQTFKATGRLDRIEIKIDQTDAPVDYTIIVAKYTVVDGQLRVTQIVYESALLTLPGDDESGYITVAHDTGGINLTPGESYIFITNAAIGMLEDNGSSYTFGYNSSYADGDFYYLNKDTGSTATDFQAPFTFYGGDMAFRLTFELPINGTENEDNLAGTAGADTINALGGNDTVNAGDGNDTVNGGSGDDTLNGEGGNDTMNGDAGNDTLNGGEGDDVLRGGTPDVRTEGSDTLNGGAGNDIIIYQSNASGNNLGGGSEANGGDGEDVLVADFSAFNGSINTQIQPDGMGGFKGQYSDYWDENVAFTSVERFEITGSNFDDSIVTGSGNDVINSGNGNDTVDAGDGNDYVDAGEGNDTVDGGAGNDTLNFSSAGADIAIGGDGDDLLFFGSEFGGNFDSVDGGAGTDTLALVGDYTVTFDADDLVGIERLSLLAGNSVDPGTSVFYDLTTIETNVAAGQTLFVQATSLREGEILNFNGTAETDGSFNIRSGAGDDSLAGGALADRLNGGAGDDQLFGLGGNDTLIGGLGTDTLRGGGGKDIFRFESADDSSTAVGEEDRIVDFQKANDKIDLSAIDADETTEGNQAFTFVGEATFSNKAGELRSSRVDDKTSLVEGDTDGDGFADFAILVTVNSAQPLTATDFIL